MKSYLWTSCRNLYIWVVVEPCAPLNCIGHIFDVIPFFVNFFRNISNNEVLNANFDKGRSSNDIFANSLFERAIWRFGGSWRWISGNVVWGGGVSRRRLRRVRGRRRLGRLAPARPLGICVWNRSSEIGNNLSTNFNTLQKLHQNYCFHILPPAGPRHRAHRGLKFCFYLESYHEIQPKGRFISFQTVFGFQYR